MVTLPESLTIETVETATASLRQLSFNADLLVDAARLERLTTPGIQLLLALEKRVLSSGYKLALQGMQEPVAEIIRYMGFDALLERTLSNQKEREE